MSKEKEKETVAKPSRYNKGKIEVWDAIRDLGLDPFQGNVLKYIARYKYKNGIEDLGKALNYAIKIIANESGEDFYRLRNMTIDQIINDPNIRREDEDEYSCFNESIGAEDED